MKKIILFILVFGLFYSCRQKQEYTLNIELSGVRYDSLILAGEHSYLRKFFRIAGQTTDGSNWKFTIPDSVYNFAASYQLFPKFTEEDSNIGYVIRIVTLHNGDTLKMYGCPFDKKVTKMSMKYVKSENIGEMLVGKIGTFDDTEGEEKTLILDYLLIPFYEDTEFEVSAKYGFRFGYKNEPFIFEDYMRKQIEVIKKHPDSHYFMESISKSLRMYDTKEELQEVFDAFSEENKKTELGKIVKNYIDEYFIFKNMNLPTWENEVLESILKDTEKINLIIFSASWCAPCHAQVPILKEIHANLNDNISMTYISLDDTATVASWKKFMTKEQIPWRSLLAKDNLEEVKSKYNPGLPSIFLLMPNSNKIEQIDVRNKKDKDRLYILCGKSPIQ